MTEGRHHKLNQDSLENLLEQCKNRREQVLHISVYNLNGARACQRACQPIGIGLYHSSLHVGAVEIGYEGNAGSEDSGLYWTHPRKSRNFTFSCSIPVRFEQDDEEASTPVCELSNAEIFGVLLPRLSQKYRANKYDLLTNNCNHFTDELLQILTAGRFRLPNYINRVANLASIFHCLVPARFLISQPPQSNAQRATPGNAIEDIHATSTAQRALLDPQENQRVQFQGSASTLQSRSAAISAQSAANQSTVPQLKLFSLMDSMNSQETSRFIQLTPSQDAANFDSMQFGSEKGIVQEEPRDQQSCSLSSMETMQSSITSQQYNPNPNNSSPNKQKALEDESKPEMYESLTNGDCFSKPKFCYEEFKSQQEQSILAPNDVFKPPDEEGDSEDDEINQLYTIRSRREERLHYGRDYNRFGIRASPAVASQRTPSPGANLQGRRRSSRRRTKPKKQPVIESFFSKINIFQRSEGAATPSVSHRR